MFKCVQYVWRGSLTPRLLLEKSRGDDLLWRETEPLATFLCFMNFLTHSSVRVVCCEMFSARAGCNIHFVHFPYH